MKMVASTTVVTLLLALPPAVLALATETFGNAPVVKQPEWAEGIIDVVNLPSRVYSYWVNGNENFFYRGNALALNEALRKYATVKDDIRQLILLPGSGKAQTLHGKPIDFQTRGQMAPGAAQRIVQDTELGQSRAGKVGQ
jgi:hypothetical protein